MTFAQECCVREIIDWVAGTGGYDKETVQDVMPGTVVKRFGQQLPLAFSHYNEHHPHSALRYRSPRNYMRRELSQP